MNSSIVPRILYPSSESFLNNVKVQVSVTGHDFWQGGQLLVVLDHGVQGLVVPASGVVDLGIVAAGRHCLSLLHNLSAFAVQNSSSSVLHDTYFSIRSKRDDSSCHSDHRKLFRPQSKDISAFQEVIEFNGRISSGQRDGLQHFVAGKGRGIVIPGGGIKQLANVWVLLRTLRWIGCTLPVEVMYVGPSEMSAQFIDAAQRLGDTTFTDILWFPECEGLALRGWPLKIRALMHSKFAEVIMLDADNVPLADPSFLFSSSAYSSTGALFWHDFTSDPHWIAPEFWSTHDLPYNAGEYEFESGQMVVDRARVWDALLVAAEINRRYSSYYRFMYGDKDTFRVAFKMTGTPYSVVPVHAELLGSLLPSSSGRALFCGDTMLHFAPEPASMPLFAHRTLSDWNTSHINITPGSQGSCDDALQLVSGCYSGDLYNSAAFAGCMAAEADGGTIKAVADVSSGVQPPKLLGRALSWTHVTDNNQGDWTVHRPHPLLLPAPDQGEGLCVFVGIDTNVTSAPHAARSVERAAAAFLAELACSGVMEELQLQASDD